MSADYDDDDVWDEPVIDVVTENKIIELDITTISKTELTQIQEMAKYASNQKLQKLNILFKNMNVFLYDNTLLVNDRYNICPDLINIAKEFGLEIKEVNCELRGKNYIIADKLTNLIRTIDSSYSYGDCAKNNEITDKIKEVISTNKFNTIVDFELSSFLHQIMKDGKLTITGSQKISSTYEDGNLINEEKQEIVSNKDEVTKKLKTFLSQTSDILQNANDNLRDGTAQLLYSRSRQMGYSVEQTKVGNKVELVLVRYE